jgi:hypothetical protein
MAGTRRSAGAPDDDLVAGDHVLIREKLAAPSAFWKPPARHLQQGLGPDGVT